MGGCGNARGNHGRAGCPVIDLDVGAVEASCLHKWGTRTGWLKMENPIKLEDFGGGTPICGTPHPQEHQFYGLYKPSLNSGFMIGFPTV